MERLDCPSCRGVGYKWDERRGVYECKACMGFGLLHTEGLYKALSSLAGTEKFGKRCA